MTKNKTLTDLVVRRAPARVDTYQLPDSQLPGLYVRIHPSGTKTFGFVFRDERSGKQVRRKLGLYPAMSLVEARNAAYELRKNGAKPKPASFADACERYLDLHASRRNRGSTLEEKRRLLQKHFIPKWASTPIADIRKRDVVAVLDEIAKQSGRSEADHAMAAVKSLFYWLESRDEIDRCPAARLPKYNERGPRDRVLSESELCSVWQAASEMNDPFGNVVQLILLWSAPEKVVRGLGYDCPDIRRTRAWLASAISLKRSSRNCVRLKFCKGRA